MKSTESTSLIDGLYYVRTAYLMAGFVVRAGRVVAVAPILRGKVRRWEANAVRIGADPFGIDLAD